MKLKLWDAALSGERRQDGEMWNAATGALLRSREARPSRTSSRIASVRDGMTCCIRRRAQQAPASRLRGNASNSVSKSRRPASSGKWPSMSGEFGHSSSCECRPFVYEVKTFRERQRGQRALRYAHRRITNAHSAKSPPILHIAPTRNLALVTDVRTLLPRRGCDGARTVCGQRRNRLLARENCGFWVRS
jgi:hypothetical protein